MTRAHFRHFTGVTVHWGDMDVLGHVNNVIFFRYVESGRIAYFDEVLQGDKAIWGGQGPILADIQCSFLRQLRYPAEIEVGTRTAKLGGKSLVLESAVFAKGSQEPVASSKAIVVWFNYKNQESVRIPDEIRGLIRNYEVQAPDEN